MITSSTANVEKGFLVLILPLTKLQNAMAQNSSNKLMKLISLKSHVNDLDCVEITDWDEVLEESELQNTKLN